MLKQAITAQSAEEEAQSKIQQEHERSSESESQFNIETIHNENNFFKDYTPNEDGNIKTTNEVNMDDIVLMQLSKGIDKRMPQAVAKIKKKPTSTSIMRSQAMKRHVTNNLPTSKQRVTFKDEI